MRVSRQDGLGAAAVARSRIARALDGLAAFAAEVGSGLSRAARDRRVLHRLSALSDRELRDIGLWRQDVRDAGLAENGEVSRFLIERRASRRAARDAVRRGGAVR